MQTLRDKIGKLRKRRGLTQEQLANKLGITYQAVSKWETGQSCPDLTLLPTLSDVLQVPIDELFGRRIKGLNLRSGLVAEYLFEGDAQDSSGNGYHGKVVGASICEDRFGNQAGSYYFDGKDDYVIVEPAPPFQDTFSLSVWCYYDAKVSLDGWHSAILSQDGQHERRVFQLSTLDSSINFHRFLAQPDLKAPVHRGYWYHIVVTYEEQMFKLYRNGVLVQAQEGNLVTAAEEPLYIGRKSTDEPSFFFHGKIDDVRIYNRALTAEEVSELFLENGWEPMTEPESLAVEDKDLPVLECLDDIQIEVPKEQIQAAAEWYMSHLGFKLLMEHQHEFYMLSLYKGPNLILRATPGTVTSPALTPFIFKTKRTIEGLKEHLSAAGANVQKVEDEGFAYFLSFTDPFGRSWLVLREKG